MPIDWDAPIPWNGVALAPSAKSGLANACYLQGQIEGFDYISPDGQTYHLHALGATALLTEQGSGMPPINYITEQGPYQHGVTPYDYRLQPRTIQMLLRVRGRNRADYWDKRNDLINLLRPNRQFVSGSQAQTSPMLSGALRYYSANGLVRQVDCLIGEGPGMTTLAQDTWDAWSIQETLRFMCHDPLWYDPQQNTINIQAPSGLVFPITFPITFFGLDETVNISYPGSFATAPHITITGPVQSPTLTNVSTGVKVELSTYIPLGRTVVIDLTGNAKTVTLDDGTNLIQYVTTDSDLSNFSLQPEPTVFQGVNVLHIFGTATAGRTTVTVQWYDRYIGI